MAARGQLAKLFIAHGISNVYFAFNDNKIERLDTSKTFTLSSFWARLHTDGGGKKVGVCTNLENVKCPPDSPCMRPPFARQWFYPFKNSQGRENLCCARATPKFFIANLWKIITKYSAFCSSLLHCRLCRLQGFQKSSQKRKLNFSVVHSLNCYPHFFLLNEHTHILHHFEQVKCICSHSICIQHSRVTETIALHSSFPYPFFFARSRKKTFRITIHTIALQSTALEICEARCIISRQTSQPYRKLETLKWSCSSILTRHECGGRIFLRFTFNFFCVFLTHLGEFNLKTFTSYAHRRFPVVSFVPRLSWLCSLSVFECIQRLIIINAGDNRVVNGWKVWSQWEKFASHFLCCCFI